MKSRLVRALLVSACAAVACGAASTSAVAAFPSIADCPTSNPNVRLCADIQSTGGFLRIKDFSVPIGTSFELRGGITDAATGNTFIPPAGTTGIFAKPIQVPGGLLGINFPIPGNAVTARVSLAGSTNNIRFDLATQQVNIPSKILLSNILLGMACKIGTDSSPIRLNMITGTTNPPAPNRPISGNLATRITVINGIPVAVGNTNVDNSFAIPGASDCGLGLGLINSLVNAKLKLPSAAGNNEVQIINDLALGFV